MKRNMLIVYSLALMAALSAHGAPGGGGGAAPAGGGAAPAGGGFAPAGGAGQANRVMPPAPGLPPGQQRPGQLQPGVANPNAQVNANAKTGVGGSNQFVAGVSNQFSLDQRNKNNAGVSNQFGANTNRFVATNQFAAGTNRWGIGSNQFANRPGPTNWGGRSTNYAPLSPASRPGGTDRVYPATRPTVPLNANPPPLTPGANQ